MKPSEAICVSEKHFRLSVSGNMYYEISLMMVRHNFSREIIAYYLEKAGY